MADGSSLCDVVFVEGEECSPFEDCESSVVDIKLLFFQTLYAWVNSVGVSFY
jgi:hypothetical protein